MALPKKKFREYLLQLMYAQETHRECDDELFALVRHNMKITLDEQESLLTALNQILLHIPALDKLITESSEEYRFERITQVEKNILRLGVFELLYDHTVPPKVAIAEAIRIARKFSSPSGASFVNAILDHVYKKHGSDLPT